MLTYSQARRAAGRVDESVYLNLRSTPLSCSTLDSPALEITPPDAISRRAVAWDGIQVELIRSAAPATVEFRFRAPCHLLLVCEEGIRGRKLTFIPAGHEFRECHYLEMRDRFMCFYFDFASLPVHTYASAPAKMLSPRVQFDNDALWHTAVKLGAAIEDDGADQRYAEALAVVLAHELACTHAGAHSQAGAARGGLAAWQQRLVAGYIEEHLAEAIPLATLASLVHLSSFYFCRAFKQSFGVPPHRYHMKRRIERAKTLLAHPARSVTEIAVALGFRETSSFSAAFRQMTGRAPTEYRRAL